jgi:uncharacterized iron-regulated protein
MVKQHLNWQRVRQALVGTGATIACVTAPIDLAHAQRPLPATAQPAVAPSEVPPNALYVPHRVARGKSWTDFEGMLQELSKADAVFLGEQHDDRGTHALQLAVLEGLARRNVQVVLALEMFERDVQPQLDAYLAGTMPESAFLAQSRPWPNYGPDYRPLVEFAKKKGWPVIASNVPRNVASMVSRGGLSALDTLIASSQPWVADERQCGPGDKYAKKFGKTMEDMGGHGSAAMPPEMIGRFYEAQCVKDETMAESIVRAFDRYPNAMVVHVAGGFHVEEGLGTVERVKRRVKQGATTRKVSDFPVVMFVPTPDLDSAKAGAQRHLGDYVVYPIK